ncbi:MAG TPA: tRNA (adenosine(37)-N6)-dimethylallyltransferase MiaA [Chthonomonadales bacterium]|nr:tRNA (adenosine(37)-N6)-dimethylallyltransferase MiaA [Chthonomonadales bacterium]
MSAPDAETDGPAVVAIVGPTAVGKSAVALEVAGALGGEILSADSVKVYRGLDIGSAKPSASDRRRAPHHLLDVAEPGEQFSVALFVALARAALRSMAERGKACVVDGGSGLYMRALLDGSALTGVPEAPQIRQRLEEEAESLGTPALHARLACEDPVVAARIHRNDRKRIVRALEVLEASGVPMSELHARDAATRRPIQAARIGLTAPRDWLHRRIDERADAMVASGLVEEVRGLLRSGLSRRAPGLTSLGYREIGGFLAGEQSLGEAVAEMKRNTRRFAKRQMTWFRADPAIEWFDVTQTPRSAIVAAAVGYVSGRRVSFDGALELWRRPSS